METLYLIRNVVLDLLAVKNNGYLNKCMIFIASYLFKLRVT